MKNNKESLLGHFENDLVIRRSIESGRPPHAWLISGPKGIGKATFVQNLIYDQLQHSESRDLGLHSHYHALRADDAAINIDKIRELIDFFSMTADSDFYRFCVIDALDGLHLNASNALLKILEEPPTKTIFFLIAHNPNLLLKTIRSRCVFSRFTYLSFEETRPPVHR